MNIADLLRRSVRLGVEGDEHAAAGRFRDAAAAYAVAADAEEEDSRPMEAWLRRVTMRRMLVANWLLERFPGRQITPRHVTPVRSPVQRRYSGVPGEVRLFCIDLTYDLLLACEQIPSDLFSACEFDTETTTLDMPASFLVRVDKKGRVREVRR